MNAGHEGAQGNCECIHSGGVGLPYQLQHPFFLCFGGENSQKAHAESVESYIFDSVFILQPPRGDRSMGMRFWCGNTRGNEKCVKLSLGHFLA
jgi:hypothetical protein